MTEENEKRKDNPTLNYLIAHRDQEDGLPVTQLQMMESLTMDIAYNFSCHVEVHISEPDMEQFPESEGCGVSYAIAPDTLERLIAEEMTADDEEVEES